VFAWGLAGTGWGRGLGPHWHVEGLGARSDGRHEGDGVVVGDAGGEQATGACKRNALAVRGGGGLWLMSAAGHFTYPSQAGESRQH